MDYQVQIINQIAEIQQKLRQEGNEDRYSRNLNKLHHIFDEQGYIYNIPLGEKYDDSRTDCEVSIAGKESRNMIITQVIKPIIYKKEGNGAKLIQKGIVIVEAK
jgi:hypothetical protein